ncbi:MAG: Uma2 family endonuclease [Bacteroidales bacterium]|jgi:Uma2 family endonuclease|nr:Uma2 family endonuclease [Bacteroidales bacterium]
MELPLDFTRQYTYADYLTWADDRMREPVNGFVGLMSPGQSRRHQQVSRELEYRLLSHVKKHKGECQIFDAPFDVRLPQKGEKEDHKINTVVHPDLCVICDHDKLDEKGCLGAPDMVVEIQSPSTARYDLREKFDLYQDAGVREYWVVYQDKAADVFILQADGKYDRGTFYQIHQSIPVHVLEGCHIRLQDIFL